MKKFLPLLLIVLLGSFLRLYKLGSVPPSLDWDEVSLAYNAQSLLETGRDEYGNFLPVTIRSFNDYKPPLYTYALIPSLFFFGRTDFAVRLPSALAGILTVIVTYFLVKELFPRGKKFSILSWRKTAAEHQRGVAIFNFQFSIPEIATLLLAISPWHLQFSRIAFEANLALLFFVLGGFGLVKSFTKPWWLAVSAGSFGLSLMAYHSTKLIIPLLVLLLITPHWKKFIMHNKKAKTTALAVDEAISMAPAVGRVKALQRTTASDAVGIYKKPLLAAALITLPFIAVILLTVVQGIGQSRLTMVSILTKDNLLDQSIERLENDNLSLLSRLFNHRYLVYAREYLGGYLDHYNLNFWFIEGDGNGRHRAVDHGLLLWWTAPFLLIGLVNLFRQNKTSRWVLLSWFLVAPAASALTSGTPNSVRALFFLPTFEIFIALGIVRVASWLQILSSRKRLLWLGGALYLFLAALNIGRYFWYYYKHTPVESAPVWQYGYKQMVAYVEDQKGSYDHIIITTTYDQPYIYMLWYGGYDPENLTNTGEFAKSFDKFVFRTINWAEDQNISNALLVGTRGEIPATGKDEWQVLFPDGSPAFVAVSTNSL